MKSSWGRALLTFFFPLVLVFFVRWALFEPYVIPSESMVPTLRVNDHVIVNKWAYGWNWPFSLKSLVRWTRPQRGDVVVFHYPPEPEIYYVKRVMGLPGDRVQVLRNRVYINGQIPHEEPLDRIPEIIPDNDERGTGYDDDRESEWMVPQGHFFVLGDNRSHSKDSRVWGSVPEDLVVGRVSLIWMACSENLPSTPFYCNPSQISWGRLFTLVK